MDKILKQASTIVRSAGEIIKKSESDSVLVHEKGSANYVTEVDFAVQDYLMDRLGALLPDSNFISEESENNVFSLDKATWIIDPLDGTTNFMYDYKCSAISVALFVDGKPSMGIVYNPDSNEMFTAISGKGAYLNDNEIHVSKCSNLSDSLIGFGTTPYQKYNSKKTFNIVEEVFSKSRDVRRSGSSALDIAFTACGRTDAYFEMILQPWDFAGGIIIITEAGGIITDWNGNPPNVLTAQPIVVSNGLIHDKLLEILK